MYLQKVISRKTFLKKLVFVGVLKVTEENRRIRDPQPKCHGSGTLLKTVTINLFPSKIMIRITIRI
jgi:hypothetical protein